jgi:hypothetical protein
LIFVEQAGFVILSHVRDILKRQKLTQRIPTGGRVSETRRLGRYVGWIMTPAHDWD